MDGSASGGGAAYPDGFDEGFTGNETWDKFKKMIDYHREYNFYFTYVLPGEVIVKGQISAIDEKVKMIQASELPKLRDRLKK